MAKKTENIMEIRQEFLISSKGGNPTKKTAHFIKPILNSTDLTPELPTTPLPQKPISLNCTFNGWRTPNQNWVSWVDRLHSTYQFIWKSSGIYEAILSSKYKIIKNEDFFFGLAERWCCETNTFVFPWGEATVTLEDVAVLGGYSVLGDSVSGGIFCDDYYETEKKLMDVHQEISRGCSQKAKQGLWMKRFMDLGSDSRVEHEAFLSLWLSRFVLPTFPFDVVVKKYFKVAICLARGVAVALAPVVLASIYRDLSLLKSAIGMVSCRSDARFDENVKDGFDDLVVVALWGPLQLVQVWGWERFPEFRPRPNAVECGEQRLARWHDVNEKDIGNVRPMLQSAGSSFEWRPYCKAVDNLCLPMFYKDEDEWVVLGDCLGDDVTSMVRFLRVCELVGMDTVEQYNPNRVAMQFGFDQDVPQPVKRDLMGSDVSKRELVQLAWLNYISTIKDEILHIPSRFYEPQVTLRYLKWLRQGVLARHAAFDGSVMRKRRSTNKSRRRLHDLRTANVVVVDDSIAIDDGIDIKPFCSTKIIDVPPGFMPMGVDNHLSTPPGYMPVDVGNHPDVPPGFMQPEIGNLLDVPPGFSPKHFADEMADVPPGFTPKSNVVGHVAPMANVATGLVPNTFAKPPAFPKLDSKERVAMLCAEQRDEHVTESKLPGLMNNFGKLPDFPKCIFPNSNGRPTTMCADKIDEHVVESKATIKKASVYSIEKGKPMLMCGCQSSSPAETGLRGEEMFKIKAKKGSVKSEQLMLGFNSEIERVNGEATTLTSANGTSELEARIRRLESMVAELTQAR